MKTLLMTGWLTRTMAALSIPLQLAGLQRRVWRGGRSMGLGSAAGPIINAFFNHSSHQT